MNIKKFLDDFRERFNEKLLVKTGWGRNEVLKAFDDSIRELLMEDLARQDV